MLELFKTAHLLPRTTQTLKNKGIVPTLASQAFLRHFSNNFKTNTALNHSGIQTAKAAPEHQFLLDKGFLKFLRSLAGEFIPMRMELMQKRAIWKRQIDAGMPLDYRADTQWIRDDKSWKGPSIPSDLKRRHVEITGPAGVTSMVINALNSGANCYMADLEDSQSPNWEGVLAGHYNIHEAVRRRLHYEKKNAAGKVEKSYVLNDQLATLFVRARGVHMVEGNIIDESGRPMPATLYDIATHLYFNANEMISRRQTPALYIPKLQSYEEACFIRDMIARCEDKLGIPQGSTRVTALIETLPGLLQCEEIVFGLGEYAAGLNCGRWDYIFSVIKTHAMNSQRILPDRGLLTMQVPFLTAYMQRIVQVCHSRGIHAMGGMSAFIPTKDPKETEEVMQKVFKDKQYEIENGCDGAWVAHPAMVAPVQAVIAKGLGGKDNQIDSDKNLALNIPVRALLDVSEKMRSAEFMTEKGLRDNISVSIQYIAAWLSGSGAVALNNLMEDMATAEISRSQVWQWLHHQTPMTFMDGQVSPLTQARFEPIFHEEIAKLEKNNQVPYAAAQMGAAVEIFTNLITAKTFIPFVQDIAYSQMSDAAEIPKPANQHFTGMHFDREKIEILQGSRPDLVRDPIKLTKHRGEHLNTVLSTLRNDGVVAYYSFLGAADGTSAVNVVAGGRGMVGPYSGGWQANAMRNRLGMSLPDTLWVAPEEPGALGEEFNNFLTNADKVQMLSYREALEKAKGLPAEQYKKQKEALDKVLVDYFATAVLADLEQGWSDPKKVRMAVHFCIQNGINVMHIEDQGSAKRCGHLGGKELRPLESWLQIMTAANFAATELLGEEQRTKQWVRFVARTDALSAERIEYSKNLEDPHHPDHPFIDWERGFTKDGRYLYPPIQH